MTHLFSPSAPLPFCLGFKKRQRKTRISKSSHLRVRALLRKAVGISTSSQNQESQNVPAPQAKQGCQKTHTTPPKPFQKKLKTKTPQNKEKHINRTHKIPQQIPGPINPIKPSKTKNQQKNNNTKKIKPNRIQKHVKKPIPRGPMLYEFMSSQLNLPIIADLSPIDLQQNLSEGREGRAATK